ncbi:MAG: molybdopterin synthase sulfur carrier subunit [Niastella sp. SCN 39-18]|nr:MoaD/ThiS family protein [Sphingobacteriales bacterium]ODT51897.1 MAG: molybdopterin synthase sulfur carrier subunit [Niastella sp. SCN 39-18]OJW11558.1 MAG: molybdopterin synthase sulfur carrier subunit [Sphingobacteriales bacterium 39-19]
MGINVLLFGQVADITGKDILKIPVVKNTNELNQLLEKTYPALKSIKYSIAVNKKVIQENTALHNEDTVAILPPFSGG